MEDDWLIALALAEALESAGCEVVGAVPTGEEAIARVLQHDPELVVLDIRLAGRMDGIETASALRQRWGGAIVFHSADNDRRVREAMAAVPSSRIVPKPAAPELVATAALDLLASSVSCH